MKRDGRLANVFASSNYPPDLAAAERFIAQMRHGTLIACSLEGYPQVSILPFVKTGDLIELHCVQADPTFDAVLANVGTTIEAANKGFADRSTMRDAIGTQLMREVILK